MAHEQLFSAEILILQKIWSFIIQKLTYEQRIDFAYAIYAKLLIKINSKMNNK